MFKKLLAATLILAMMLSLVACGGSPEEKQWSGTLPGEWVANKQYVEEFPNGITFDEKTCTINGDEYEWEIEYAYSNGADIYIKDGKDVVYKMFVSLFDDGYHCLSMNTVNEDGDTEDYIADFYKAEEFEKIDITNENWEEYLEVVKMPMTTSKDSFDEINYASFSEYLMLKDGYGKVCESLSKCAVEYSYVHTNYKATIDLDNKSYALGEKTYTATSRNTSTSEMYCQYNDGEYASYGISVGGVSFDEFPEDTVSVNEDVKIERIKGTIYCQKGE